MEARYKLMALLLFILGFLYSSHIAAAQDPIQGILQQGPCFETVETPSECNATLAQSFKPRSPSVTGDEPTTEVFLFTPSNPDKAELLHKCGGRLPPGSTYDPNSETEVFIHGWLDGVCRTAWNRIFPVSEVNVSVKAGAIHLNSGRQRKNLTFIVSQGEGQVCPPSIWLKFLYDLGKVYEMKEQLWERAKRLNTSYNVILVDWTWGNTPDYFVASQNCKIVGEQVGFVINNIIDQKKSEGVGPNKFHVVGHSFGAIATGFVGRSVKGLRRITALDPAYAPFGNAPPNERVTYRDAKIVDVIHSNGAECYAVGIGDIRQLGHADFYPNEGTVQPSCYSYIIPSFLKGDFFYALGSLDPRLCFHLQSIQFYKVSINPADGCQLIGLSSRSYEQFQNQPSRIKRGNWAIMGMDYERYNINDGRRRIFYLKTSNFCPYYDYSYLRRASRLPSNITCAA